MFIQTQNTPNEHSIMFFPGKEVMGTGNHDFPTARAAMASPLAKVTHSTPTSLSGRPSLSNPSASARPTHPAPLSRSPPLPSFRIPSLHPPYPPNSPSQKLFSIDGVTNVFFGSDFVTVSKAEDTDWGVLKPEVFAAMMDHFTSGADLFLSDAAIGASDTTIHEDDSEVVAMIKELLDTRIRPAVQEDGGDIIFHEFDDNLGIVRLKMVGACKGCSSSAVTLKTGVENMLKHYIPEVVSVEQYEDEAEQEGKRVFNALEQHLSN